VYKQNLKARLAPVLAAVPRPTYVVMQLAGTATWEADTISDRLIQTWFSRTDVHLRVLQSVPPPTPAWKTWWRVELGDDAAGVRFVVPLSDDPRPVPWTHVAIVRFDGEQVVVPPVVASTDLVGLEVDVRRATPISQAELVRRLQSP